MDPFRDFSSGKNVSVNQVPPQRLYFNGFVGALHLLARGILAQRVPILVVAANVFSAALLFNQKCFINPSFEYAEWRFSEKSFARYFTSKKLDPVSMAFTPLVTRKPDHNDRSRVLAIKTPFASSKKFSERVDETTLKSLSDSENDEAAIRRAF